MNDSRWFWTASLGRMTLLPDGVECRFGCRNHVKHECEGCGRIMARYTIKTGDRVEIHLPDGRWVTGLTAEVNHEGIRFYNDQSEWWIQEAFFVVVLGKEKFTESPFRWRPTPWRDLKINSF